jgi:hypothetical protein
MPPIQRLQPTRYNFGVFTLQPLWRYTLIVNQDQMKGEMTMLLCMTYDLNETSKGIPFLDPDKNGGV